jgi:predicted HD phosphohydrolase
MKTSVRMIHDCKSRDESIFHKRNESSVRSARSNADPEQNRTPTHTHQKATFSTNAVNDQRYDEGVVDSLVYRSLKHHHIIPTHPSVDYNKVFTSRIS